MPTLINPQSHMPDLDLPLVGGGRFNIADVQAEKFLIMVFYRGFHCPKCKTQLQEIDAQYNDLISKGYQFVAVSMDGQERADKAKSEWDLKFLPIAYDLPLMTAKTYGLFISDGRPDTKEPKLFSEPGLFVVKGDGALYAEYIQNTPFGRPPIGDIIGGLEFVIEKGYPTRGTSTA